MTEYRAGCLLMAAGNARRFGRNKLAQTIDGKSLIRRAMEAVPTELLAKVAVVTQYPEIEDMAREFSFQTIHNQHPDWGISHTISLGLNALDDCQAVLFMVCDQPMLQRETVAGLLRFGREHPRQIIGLSHGGVRGNPCLFPAAFFPQLRALREDQGGNQVIRRHEDQLLLYEAPAVELTDVDHPRALQELQRELQAAKDKEE